MAKSPLRAPAAGSIDPVVNPTTGEVRYAVRARVNGVRNRYGIYNTRAEAEARLAAVLKSAGPAVGGLTLRAWGIVWLRRREAERSATLKDRRNRRKERNRWENYIDEWECVDWPARKVTRQDVVRWVKALIRRPLAKTTVSNALTLLRRALQDAADDGHVASNVAVDVEVPKVPREDEPWTWLRKAEVERVLALPLRADQRAILTLAIYTGLRAGELWGLRWEDVQGTELRVARSYDGPTKGGIVRRVPLLAPALEALAVWRRKRPGVGGALVFPLLRATRHGPAGAMHNEGYDAGWGHVAKRAGVDARFHDLRHTCASHLIQGTWTPRPLSLEQVQSWLGHASRTTTERYAHLAPDGILAIAAEARREGKR